MASQHDLVVIPSDLSVPLDQQTSINSNCHPMITGSKVSVYKSKAYTTIISSVESSDIHEAMFIPSWNNVVHDELQTLVKNNT